METVKAIILHVLNLLSLSFFSTRGRDRLRLVLPSPADSSSTLQRCHPERSLSAAGGGEGVVLVAAVVVGRR